MERKGLSALLAGVTLATLVSAGSVDTAPDWQITGNLTVNLRAERAGSGSGRVYTIFVQCTDNAGQSTGTATTVLVPH